MANVGCIILWFLGGFEMYLTLISLPKSGLPKRPRPPDHPPWADTCGNVFWAVLWPLAVVILIVKCLFFYLYDE